MYSLHVLVGNIVDDKLLHQVDAVVLPTNPMMRWKATRKDDLVLAILMSQDATK